MFESATIKTRARTRARMAQAATTQGPIVLKSKLVMMLSVAVLSLLWRSLRQSHTRCLFIYCTVILKVKIIKSFPFNYKEKVRIMNWDTVTAPL
jgi:hypothetical protein